MTFVVYDTDSIRITTRCATQAGAKRAAKAAAKRGENVAWTTSDNYNVNVNVMTTTYNMLDPHRRPIDIRLADKGGCCDPATETYHSM